MDGLSEQKNQWIEQYLQIITRGQPEDWHRWLAIATAVHNNQTNSTTKLSPNKVLIGHQIKLLPDIITKT